MAGLLSMLGRAGQAAKGISPTALAGGATAGALIAGGTMAGNEKEKIRQYQALRKYIKDQTGGLGGLVYSKENDNFMITYGDSVKNAKKKGHYALLHQVRKAGSDKLDIGFHKGIAFMSDKKSKEMNNAIKNSLKTEKGREQLSSYINVQTSNPYSNDYMENRKDGFGFGTKR